MLGRLHIYLKERFPVIPRLLLGFIAFFEIYFIILLNDGVTSFDLGVQEFVGGYTIFAFLLWLRVADDFKDHETDKKLFPERPLARGAVKKQDLIVFTTIIEVIAVILNIIFMPNIWFFAILYLYGYLMSQWFFQKSKIQPSLPLALITHNPVQLFINLYTISFVCIKYSLPFLQLTTILALWTLYFPALIWEIARKIKAPKDENDYTTYSKLFGYKKATKFIMVLTIVDIITNFVLVWNLNKISVVVLFLLASWMTCMFIRFMKNPEKFKLVDKVELYTYLQEGTMLLTIVVYLLIGQI